MPADLAAAAREMEIAELWYGSGAAPGVRKVAMRTRNALVRNGFLTVADLTALSAEDLTDLRTFGAGCLAEVRRVLAAHGLHLKGEEAGDAQ
jgi:hypothetical protein